MVLAGGAIADEFRAFWVDAWGAGFLNQTQVNQLLGVVGDPNSKGDIRNANCNAVVVQVRRNCDACYPSSMGEPYMSGLSPSNFNALQAIINAAHDTTGGKQRIEVHCWMVTFRTSGGTVYGKHDDAPTGSLTTLDNYWPTRDDAGAETSDYAFDPGHPLVEEYTSNVALDIVKNFDIDGIHYDYIRFTANNQGYNPTSVARYNARYGLSGQPSSSNSQWQQWRRDQISNLVRRIYAKIQTIKPWVKQSGSFVTWNPSPTSSTRSGFQGTRPYYDVYSDWDSWLQEGSVDAAIPMTYYNYASLPSDWTRWINFEKDRHGNRHMYIGPGIYLNSLSNSILEFQQTRTPSPSGNYAQGFCGYSYRVPYSGGTWADFSPTFTSQVCPTQANIPAMPWKTSPTKGHISGTVTYYGTNAWADGATVSITGPESRSQYCDGTGFYAFIDLTPGTYTVTFSKSGYANVVKTVSVAIGSVTGNMYVTDAVLGGTSAPSITNVASSGVTNNAATITWNTDQAADSQVEYGTTTSYGALSPLNSSAVTAHSVTLTGLAQKMTYHYRVHSSNANGPAVSSDYTFTTGGAPTITNVQSGSITSTSATITWTTDVSSDSKVNYGTTTSYGSQATDASSVTSHSMTLTGLTPNTTYHYQCVSANTYGSTASTDYTFTTASGTPVITNVQSSGVTNTAATITWTTDTASDSKVDYGTTTSYGSQQSSASAVTSHSISLTGLTPNTTYHYKCSSTNVYGTGVSSDYTFTTNGPPTISNVQATGITSNTAVITWSTNVASDSKVNYGTTASYGSQGTNASSVTSHTITLTGLTASTTYHYQCVSANNYGTATSTDFTFTTAAPVSEIIVDNTDAGWTDTSTGSHAWTAAAVTGVPKIGSNYLYHAGDGSLTESSSTCKCRWTPNLTATGLYDVYVYYQMGTNRNTSAPYKVYYSGGSLASDQNQYSSVANQGGWFLVGQDLPFTAGNSGYVELTTLSSSTALVSADAAKWVLKSAQDIVKPTITNVQATGVTGASATITWNTDVVSDSKVNYGTTTSYGSQQADPAAVTSHSVTLAGLTPGVTYHYQCASTNAMGTTTTGDFTFTTSSPPTIVNPIQVTGITAGSATVVWTTSVASDSRVNYGTTAGYGSYQSDGALATSHSIALNGLASATRYHFQVVSANVAGTVTSSDLTFDTNGPPTMTSVTDEQYTTSTTQLAATWSAEEMHSGISRYEYAVGTTSGGTEIKGWTSAGTATSLTIGGLSLATGSTYYISARAVNGENLTSAPMTSSGVRIARAVSGVQEAKGRPDGDAIALPALKVSARFADKFYIESDNRVSGIRVESGTVVSPGQAVTVCGIMGLADGCERAILSPKVVAGGSGTAVKPLFLTGSAIGGTRFSSTTPGITDGVGLYNIGLLVRVTGAVGDIAPDGFYLDDGSGVTDDSGIAGIKIWTGSSSGPGTWATVTGVVSCRESGGKVYPIVLATQVTPL